MVLARVKRSLECEVSERLEEGRYELDALKGKARLTATAYAVNESFHLTHFAMCTTLSFDSRQIHDTMSKWMLSALSQA